MDLSSVLASPSNGKADEKYKKAVAMAATVTAYSVLARSMAKELLPQELRAAARWAVSALLPRPKQRRTKTILIGRYTETHDIESLLYWEVRRYLSSRIDPAAVDRLGLTVGGPGLGHQILSIPPGESTTDVFEGVKFTWTLTYADDSRRRGRDADTGGDERRAAPDTLAVSFDAEHMEVALRRYVPFIMATMEEARRQERALKIYRMSSGSHSPWEGSGTSWEGLSHHHPATFDTLAMDPALKQDVVADLDRFLKRRDYYRRIGKAWKRGYMLYGPPGTGKSSLVAAMANYLRFNLYDLDLSVVYTNSALQRLLTTMKNKSILVIEDIDCCFSTKSREAAGAKAKQQHKPDRTKNGGDGGGIDSGHDSSSSDDDSPPPPRNPRSNMKEGVTLSGMLNFIDGLWSTSGEERIIVFTTNYKDRLDRALLRPGRMDMHIYMGYCGWEAFRTLARNYFLVDDHDLFPEIRELLSAVEVTPAEVSEMLLRSEDVDAALQGFAEFLHGKSSK